MLSLIRTGTLYINAKVDLAALPALLADGLRSVHAHAVEIRGNSVMFTGGMFRPVGNWNVLVAFGFGDLTVDPVARQVHYRVNFRQQVIFASIFVSVMTILILFSPVWQPLLVMPLTWFWLVYGNLAIGIPRFERFLSRTIAAAPHCSA